MRRIYDSRALERDDSNPFHPNEDDATETPQAMRSVPVTVLSRQLVPHWLRYRSITIDVSTPSSEYPSGSPIPIAITIRNVMPFPIAIPTNSPILWNWYVDEYPEASRIPVNDPPNEQSEFAFTRGERKRFHKRWDQMFRTATDEWERATPGTYTLSASLNVDDPVRRSLYDETTIRIS